MTYKISNFSIIDNAMGSTISVSYHTYGEDGNILRSNLRKSFMINDNPTLIKDDGTEIHILDASRDIATFILKQLGES